MDDEHTMHDLLQDALDDLASPRSSLSRKGRALATLERLVADIYVPDKPSGLHTFLSLQDTFQCNIPSRLLVWISTTASRLDSLTSVPEFAISKQRPEDATETVTLAVHLVQALSIVQGIALSHAGSKRFLGRRYALEILVHLFLVSRRVPAKATMSRSVSTPSPTGSISSSSSNEAKKDTPALAAVVLDTLSCILVDAPPAMRAFEDAGGVRAVVRVLKRPGTGREVKIKCMEFLYFYVNAENPAWTQDSSPGAFSLEDVHGHPELQAVSDNHHIKFPLDFIPTAPNSPTAVNFASPDATSTPPNAKPAPPAITPLARRASHRSTQSLSQPASTTSSPHTSSPPAAAFNTPATSHPARPGTRPLALQVQRKESSSLRTLAETESAGLATPKKGQQTPREYPKTPRKTLQPLNLQSATRRTSNSQAHTHALAPAAVVQEGGVGGHRRVPSSTSPGAGTNARPTAGMGHKRAQTQLSIDVSPRNGVTGVRPASALASDTPCAAHPPSRPGHKRAQSSLDLRHSHLHPHPHGYAHTSSPPMTPSCPAIPETPLGVLETPRPAFDASGRRTAPVQMRTKEEKTEILRGMMSNVDALLEGMSRVGIWGLA